MNRCEDFPCCGHTYDDPCGPQWYDAPDAFDTRVNPHALCDHEYGDCYVEYDDEEAEEEEKDDEYLSDPYVMEDQWLDGSYEE